MLFCLVPHLRLSDIFLLIIRVPFGKVPSNIILKAKRSHHMLCKRDTSLKLFNHLIRTYNQMSLADRKLADAGKAVHLP